MNPPTARRIPPLRHWLRSARDEVRKHPIRMSILALSTAGVLASIALRDFHPLFLLLGGVYLLTAYIYIWTTR